MLGGGGGGGGGLSEEGGTTTNSKLRSNGLNLARKVHSFLACLPMHGLWLKIFDTRSNQSVSYLFLL